MIHLTVQQLSAALDGALTGPSLELVVRHLAACHECRDRQARLNKYDDALRRLLAQDPGEEFMDDLTKRAEAWVIAIARGAPEPMPHASVPLPHEEDPASPVEPPPPPPRPELGRAGELASEAGWGRIGLKPTASTHAPESDPEEAQRLLEALERGEVSDFTELTAQGLREHTPIDGPVFDLPSWLQEQSRRAAEPREGPREVPKVNLYFEKLDERAADLTRAAVNEVFRRDDPAPSTTSADDTIELPPEHQAFAPPGFRLPVATTPVTSHLRIMGGSRDGSSPRLPDSLPAPISSESQPSYVTLPMPPLADDPAPDAAHASPRPDRARVMALMSVSGLILVLFVLQLFPATTSHPDGDRRAAWPELRFRPNDTAPESPSVRDAQVRNAATRLPVEQVLPRVHEPGAESSPGPDSSVVVGGIPPVIEPETTIVEQAPPVVRGPKPVTPARRNSTPVPTPTTPTPKTEPPPPAVTKDDGDWPLFCGSVVDSNGRPVAGARVTVTEIAFTVRTDAKGRFCLSAPAGMQHLLVEAPGYSEARDAVKITAGQPEVRLTLTPAR